MTAYLKMAKLEILIGNKSDDLDGRIVFKEDIEKFVNETPCINAYIETSAKTGENVQLAFETAIKEVLPQLKPQKKQISEEARILITNLRKYNSDVIKKPYNSGFWINNTSRAYNREINSKLSAAVANELEEGKSIKDAFSKNNIKQLRKMVIEKDKIDEREGYVKRKASGKFNIIKKEAENYCKILKRL